MDNLEPITREETLLDGGDLTPITRKEMFIKRIYDKTQSVPEPITREEYFLAKAGEGSGGDVTIEQLNVTENGTYSESGKAYSPVVVNVPTPPVPENAYLLNDLSGLPADIASFNDGTDLPMASLKVAVTPYQDLSHGDPSPSNICPIIGWDEAVVTRCGKNLWGGEKLADDIVAKVPQASKDTTNKTVTYHASQITRKVLFDNFKENTQYTIYLSTSSQYTNIGISYADGTSESIAPNTYKTTPANKTVTQVVGQWATGSTVLNYEECGIFEGVITTDDFVPYNGATYTIDLNGTRYGGVVDATNGTMTVDRGFYTISSGTALVSFTESSTYGSYAIISNIGNQKANISEVCAIASEAKGVSYNDRVAEPTIDRVFTNEQGGVILRASNNVSIPDATTFLSYFNGCQICYELATPITVQLSPTQVKSLEGVNNINANCGQITEVKYFKKA